MTDDHPLQPRRFHGTHARVYQSSSDMAHDSVRLILRADDTQGTAYAWLDGDALTDYRPVEPEGPATHDAPIPGVVIREPDARLILEALAQHFGQPEQVRALQAEADALRADLGTVTEERTEARHDAIVAGMEAERWRAVAEERTHQAVALEANLADLRPFVWSHTAPQYLLPEVEGGVVEPSEAGRMWQVPTDSHDAAVAAALAPLQEQLAEAQATLARERAGWEGARREGAEQVARLQERARRLQDRVMDVTNERDQARVALAQAQEPAAPVKPAEDWPNLVRDAEGDLWARTAERVNGSPIYACDSTPNRRTLEGIRDTYPGEVVVMGAPFLVRDRQGDVWRRSEGLNDDGLPVYRLESIPPLAAQGRTLAEIGNLYRGWTVEEQDAPVDGAPSTD